jgi:hypothetical protein
VSSLYNTTKLIIDWFTSTRGITVETEFTKPKFTNDLFHSPPSITGEGGGGGRRGEGERGGGRGREEGGGGGIKGGIHNLECMEG